MDATVTSILSKSQEDLDRLYKAGVRHLYIGIESGLDDVLTFMEKDHGLEEAYEAIRRLKKAGLIYDAHIMTGVAGHGRGRENAEALAEFFNRTQPRHIVNFSLFLHKDVSLYEEIKNGRFVPADELENLQEERRLLELLEEAQEIRYDGLHDFLEIRVRGILPREKERCWKNWTGPLQRRREKESRPGWRACRFRKGDIKKSYGTMDFCILQLTGE